MGVTCTKINTELSEPIIAKSNKIEEFKSELSKSEASKSVLTGIVVDSIDKPCTPKDIGSEKYTWLRTVNRKWKKWYKGV